MTKAAYPTIGIAAFVMFVIVYFIGCLHNVVGVNVLPNYSSYKRIVFWIMIIFFYSDSTYPSLTQRTLWLLLSSDIVIFSAACKYLKHLAPL